MREWRRMRAWELSEQGWSGTAIAVALGVSKAAVSGWLKKATQHGVEALRRRPPPGPTPKLTAEQRATLPALLEPGAEAYGFVGDVWTTKRVTVIIKRQWGVSYHPAHVSRLLRQVGWTVQQPIERASQRNEAALAQWRAETAPALFAKPRRRSARSSS